MMQSCRHWWNCRTSPVPLQWRHNECDCVSNHQPHDCLLNRLFRQRSKKTLKLRVTGLCAGNSPVTGEFTAQMVSNAEDALIWWRHHAMCCGVEHSLGGEVWRGTSPGAHFSNMDWLWISNPVPYEVLNEINYPLLRIHHEKLSFWMN